MDQVEIREITYEDIEGFHACLDEVAREKAYLAIEEAPPLVEARGFVEAAIQRGDVRVIALEKGRVVGWCDITAHRYQSMEHVGQLGMGVLKHYRNQGVGRQLLNRALELARDAGLEKVELDVFASNSPAITLYRGTGFFDEGTRERARKFRGGYEDIIQMGLFLNL